MIAADLLLYAYRCGTFPMALKDGDVAWFSPDPRAIIPIDDRFHIPHGLARTLKKRPFEIRFDTAFESVILACGSREETWINREIFDSYVNLHHLGHAHSVEAWKDGELVGGLYGVSIGGAFFGESMFHRVTDASKVALHALVMRMRERGYRLLDTQWPTEHLLNFGTYTVPRAEYLAMLCEAAALDCAFS